jgi:gamma-glutamyl:cysteine ligase YbdK (ATP-grasp superfamily)
MTVSTATRFITGMGIEIEGQVTRSLPRGLRLTEALYNQGFGKPDEDTLADAVIAAYNQHANRAGHCEPETPQGSIEYVGEVAVNFSQFREEFRGDMETLLQVLKEHKATILWTGTHPIAPLFGPKRQGYGRTQNLPDSVSRMFSIHANFSLRPLLQARGWEGILSALNILQNFYSMVVGVCANSLAADGYVNASSMRTWVRSGTRFGPPPIWTSIQQLVDSSNLFLQFGLVTDVHQQWHMSRLKFLTKDGIPLKKSRKPINLEEVADVILEIRSPDAAISPKWAQAEFAFLLALTEHIVGSLIEGKTLPQLSAEAIRQENLYQAWTKGLKAAMIIRVPKGAKKAVAVEEGEGIAYYKKSIMKHEVLTLIDEHLLPLAGARDLGCEQELRYLRKQVARRRNGASIQREVIKKYKGGEEGVIGLLEWLMKRPFTRGFLPPKEKR